MSSRISTQRHYRQNKSCHCPPSTDSLRTSLQGSRTQSPVRSPAQLKINVTPLVFWLICFPGWASIMRREVAYPEPLWLWQDCGRSTVQSGHNSQGIWLLVVISRGDYKWIQQEPTSFECHQIKMREHQRISLVFIRIKSSKCYTSVFPENKFLAGDRDVNSRRKKMCSSRDAS